MPQLPIYGAGTLSLSLSTVQRGKHWYRFLAATKELLKHFFPSACLPVRPSVTPFSLCSHHCITMKFSGVIANDRRDVHANDQGQMSKVKVTGVKTQFSRFQTVTQVWIHIWRWNDAQSLMLLRRGAILYFKVIGQIPKWHGYKIVCFDPNWAFPDCKSRVNSPMTMKLCT